MPKLLKYSAIIFIFFITFLLKDYIYHTLSYLNAPNNNEKVLIELEETKRLNAELSRELIAASELYGLQTNTQSAHILAKISIRNPYYFYDTLTINKGSNDKIKNGSAVFNAEGLIGVITKVNKRSSRVELITKATNEISVIIHGRYGIITGYSKEEESLIIKNINNYDNIEINDLVYTSGLGNLPGGIYVGKVEKIIYDKYQIEQSIYVKTKIDFDKLNYVGIISKEVEKWVSPFYF